MKIKFASILIFFFLSLSSLFSQYEVWNKQGYSVGMDAPVAGITSVAFMPEIIRINSTYFMYYTGRYMNISAIYYATSLDMVAWTVQDTIMVGSSDTTNRRFEIGGQSVIKLNSGQYRMFYRTSQKPTTGSPPLYHIRSAISNDGISYTPEAGVRMEIQPYQANSYFTLAGQSAFYKDLGGNTRAIITGIDSSMSMSTPARLYTASSTDEGLTWGNYAPLYDGCHDAVVIRDSTDKYHLYCSYLMQGHRKAESVDGMGWPPANDSILLKDGTNLLTEESAPDNIADIGAGVNALGDIVLYSNFKPLPPGPWIDVAYYYPDITSGIENSSYKNSFLVYPNPSSDYFYYNNPMDASVNIRIYAINGEIKFSGNLQPNSRIDIKDWPAGIYYYTIETENNVVEHGKLMVIK